MLRDSTWSVPSCSAIAALVLCGAACRDVSGQCSSRTDTLCLQIDAVALTSIPDEVKLTLSSSTGSPMMDYPGIAATLAQRPYVVEVSFGSTPPAMLTINAVGNLNSQPVASAQVTLNPLDLTKVARPTLVSLKPVAGVGNDLGMSADQAGTDAATTPDLQATPWHVVYSITGTPLNALIGINPATPTMYAVGNSGLVVRGDGTTFAATTATAGTGTLSGIWPASPTEAFACDQQGNAYHTTTGGTTWSAGVPIGYQLNGVYGRSNTDVLVVGNSLTAAAQWDGTMWKSVAHNQGAFQNAVFASAGFYYIGSSGTMGAKAANPAMVWTTITSGTGAGMRAMAGLGTTDNYTVAVAPNGFVQSYAGVGTAWTSLASPVNTALAGVWVAAVGNVVVGGVNGVVMRYAGGAWTSISNSNLSGYNITGVWGDGGSGIWVAANKGTDGAIFKY